MNYNFYKTKATGRIRIRVGLFGRVIPQIEIEETGYPCWWRARPDVQEEPPAVSTELYWRDMTRHDVPKKIFEAVK